MKAREKLGTNIGAVIYDAEPDIKTLIRTKSSGGETLGRFASFMDRPLLQDRNPLTRNLVQFFNYNSTT